jgi:hypothetical protein
MSTVRLTTRARVAVRVPLVALMAAGAVVLASSTAVAAVPGAPTAVSATPGDQQAVVSWTAPANTGGNAIDSYTVTSAPGAKTAKVTASGGVVPTTATVTGLTNGTAYTFTVTAHNASGASAASAPSAAVTPFGKPGMPTNVAATAGNGQATVTWTAPSNNGARIDRYTVTTSPGGTTTDVNAPNGTSAAPTSVTITGLTNGTAFTFTVVAHNAAGNGPGSAASSPVTPALGAATNVTATPGDTKVTVAWTAPTPATGDSIKDFVVKNTPGNGSKTVAANVRTTDVTGLTNGTPYTFTVVTEYTSGGSATSAATTAVTPFGKPLAPSGVTASSSTPTSVTVQWVAANNNGAAIDSYTVSSSPGNKSVTVMGTGGAAPPTTATVTGLTTGTSYTFTVVAHNAAGTGPASAPSNAAMPRFATAMATLATQTITGGHTTTIGGTLLRSDGTPVANGVLDLSQRFGGSSAFRDIGLITTGSDGSWTATVEPAMHTTYLASYGGDANNAPTTGQEVVLVRSAVTVLVPHSGATVRHGVITFTASVADAIAGTRGSLQYRRSDGSWHTLAIGQVASNHRLVLSRTLGRGTLVMRIVVNKSAYNFGASSRAFTLHLS